MYRNYLKSQHWQQTKQKFYSENRYRCYFCNKKNKLEIHHITYENIGHEMIEDMVYLCHNCHIKATFSKEKDVIQKWLERKRKRNLKARMYPKKELSFRQKIRKYNKKHKYDT